MLTKKQPERTCIACRETKNKNSFIRIVKTSENEFLLDKTGKVNGRGAYICNDVKCLEKVVKSKALHRTFKCEIPAEVYQKLKGEFDCNN